MELVPNDIEYSLALEEALNHPAPFSLDELKTIRELHVNYVSAIDEIKYCTELEKLSIKYSNVDNLELLGALSELKTLAIVATPIKNVDFIGNLKKLERLTVEFTLVQDAVNVLEMKSLKSIAVLGNPWSSDFNKKLVDYSFSHDSDKVLSLSYSSEKIWEFSRKMGDQGYCFAYIDTRPFLVRPGKPILPNSECDFIPVSMSYLEHMLKTEDLALEQLFTLFSERAKEMPYRQFELHNRYEIGTKGLALDWIDSGEFTSQERAGLKKFVNNFPYAYFYNEDNSILNEEESKFKISFPSWFVETRQSLAFIYPDHISTIQLDEFSLNKEMYKSVENRWFTFELYGTPGTEEELLIDNERKLYALGYYGNYVICINVNGVDKRVYMYNQADLGIESELAFPIFNSYIEMLSNITSIKLENGLVINAAKNPH